MEGEKKNNIEVAISEIATLLLKGVNFSRSFVSLEIVDTVPGEGEDCMGAHDYGLETLMSIIYLKKELLFVEKTSDFFRGLIPTLSHELFHMINAEMFQFVETAKKVNKKTVNLINEKTALMAEEMIKNAFIYHDDILKKLEELKLLLRDYNL